MASPLDGWDDQQMLDQYLYDYFIKRKLPKTAAIFREQANVATKPVEINDSAQGFLYDWWTMFYDVYVYRQSRKRQDVKGKAPVNAEKMSQNEERNAYQIAPQLTINKQKHGQFPFGCNFDKMLGQPGSSLIAARTFEKQCHPVRNYDPQLEAFDVNKPNLSNSGSAISSYLLPQAEQLFLRDNRNGATTGRARPLRTNPYGPQTGTGDGWLSPSYLQKFPLLMQQYQPSLLTQVLSLASENLKSASPGSSANFQAPNLILPKSNLNMKDAQMRIQMKQTQEKQNQHAQCLQQQLSENDRKRKRLSYSRAEDQTLDSVNAEEDKSANEDVESFLSTDDDHGDVKGTPFSTLKRRSTACSDNDRRGFTFEEIGCLSSIKSKVLCCHFSSDGKMLASSGHEKKVSIWDMENFKASSSSEGHSLLITDVRFRSSSTILATGSFDRTVRIWDAAKPSKSLFKLLGHTEQVMSLDFHPRKVDLLCSCDGNDEIRLWNVNKHTCMRVSKGATRQVRFQPGFGKLLATAMGNSINVIDVEVGSLMWNLKGHAKEVLSICWDTSGKYIASVSEDSAQVWSLVGGNCLGKLLSNGNKFQSCAFHPGYSLLLIIGGYQVLEFWSPTDGGKTWSIPAHGGLIAALADSVENEMIASASHDQCVKLWK